MPTAERLNGPRPFNAWKDLEENHIPHLRVYSGYGVVIVVFADRSCALVHDKTGDVFATWTD